MARREFSPPTKRAALKRANGHCECRLLFLAGIPGFTAPDGCGAALGPGNTYYEHIICDGAGGEPTLDNCAVLVKTCWSRKTRFHDQPRVAKTKRQHDRDSGIKARRGCPLPGTKASGIRRRMSGRVERW